MQHLYLMRGPQGSGKSTFLRENALQPWVLSFDALRLMLGSLEMDRHGRMVASHAHEDRLFARFREMLEIRMAQGQTTFIDATHMDNDFTLYEGLAQRWGYSVNIIDFGTDLSVDQLMQRIESRSVKAPENYVPREAVVRTLDKLSRRTTPEWARLLTPQEAAQDLNAGIPDWTAQYDGVLFVGDVQGCATALRQLIDQHYSDRLLIVFIGDLFDRGPENGEVLGIMLELLNQPNVRLLCGNHERHLLSWRNGMTTPSEFRDRTLPQLHQHGFSPEIADFFIKRWDNLLQFQFGDALIQASHGGTPGVIERPLLFPGYQCWKGVGFYGDGVDELFEANSQKPWHQVHGHRNANSRDLVANQRSFNLESSVEYGGHLRALAFDGEAFSPIHIKNRVFVPMTERDLRHDTMIPEWIRTMAANNTPGHEALEATRVSEQDLLDLRNHELIRESVQKSHPHISSFNFTRDAFYSQSYDGCNVRARGLYINTETREIVIRGYDKYFNVNESGIPQAQLSVLLEKTQPPYTSTIKENGYLGLVGYDSKTDTLICASKSTTTGDHALWLAEQLDTQLNETEKMRLKNTLRDCQLSLAFEVIEPERDPHIIEYDAPKIVLLDGIRRSLEFKKISHAELETLAKIFGFECKEKGPHLPNKAALNGFLSSASKKGFQHNGKEIEGLVLEDANGHMMKIKLPYYILWKHARSAMMAVNRFHEKGVPIKPHFRTDPVIDTFVDWLIKQEPEMAKRDIVQVRKLFLDDHPEHAAATSKKFQIERESEMSL